LISGKHAPGVPVQVSPKGAVLSFPKAIEVLGGKASGDADEHVIEGEAKELRVPAATGKGQFGEDNYLSYWLQTADFLKSTQPLFPHQPTQNSIIT
jgi:hypothetical protein